MNCTVMVFVQPGYGVCCEIFFKVNIADEDPLPEQGAPRICSGEVGTLQCVDVNCNRGRGSQQLDVACAEPMETTACGADCSQFLFFGSKLAV